ncbi:hypothetical protein D3C86_1405660 [compost metagenome]
MTESSTLAQLWTLTPENSIELVTVAPEMMQPLEISESIATPRRSLSLNTNLAGGSCF